MLVSDSSLSAIFGGCPMTYDIKSDPEVEYDYCDTKSKTPFKALKSPTFKILEHPDMKSPLFSSSDGLRFVLPPGNYTLLYEVVFSFLLIL